MNDIAARNALRGMLLRIAARHLWLAIPKELEDYLVAYIMGNIISEFWNEEPGGVLSGILTECAWAYHVGWLDLKDSDPYSQMPEQFEMPSFEVMGPHGARVKITECENCEEFFAADEASMKRMVRECRTYGHFYLR